MSRTRQRRNPNPSGKKGGAPGKDDTVDAGDGGARSKDKSVRTRDGAVRSRDERMHNRLAALRAVRGVTYRKLAEELGVHYQTMGYLEHGEYAPSLYLALRVARWFDVPAEPVFSFDEFPSLI